MHRFFDIKMKFDLEIRNIQSSKRIILPFLCTYPRSFGRVESIIDTGAPTTVISASDGIRLRLSFDNFESTKPLKGVGRGEIPCLLINNFKITLHSNNNERKEFSFPVVAVDVPTLRKFGEDALNQASMLPTLIGLDFLKLNNLKLFVDLQNNIAYLEE